MTANPNPDREPAALLAREEREPAILPVGESEQRDAIVEALAKALIYVGDLAHHAGERVVVDLRDVDQVLALARILTSRDEKFPDEWLGKNTRELWSSIASALGGATERVTSMQVSQSGQDTPSSQPEVGKSSQNFTPARSPEGPASAPTAVVSEPLSVDERRLVDEWEATLSVDTETEWPCVRRAEFREILAIISRLSSSASPTPTMTPEVRDEARAILLSDDPDDYPRRAMLVDELLRNHAASSPTLPAETGSPDTARMDWWDTHMPNSIFWTDRGGSISQGMTMRRLTDAAMRSGSLPSEPRDTPNFEARPWSLRSSVTRLVVAAKHLVDRHNCDHHGWEEVGHAIATCEEWLAIPPSEPREAGTDAPRDYDAYDLSWRGHLVHSSLPSSTRVQLRDSEVIAYLDAHSDVALSLVEVDDKPSAPDSGSGETPKDDPSQYECPKRNAAGEKCISLKDHDGRCDFPSEDIEQFIHPDGEPKSAAVVSESPDGEAPKPRHPHPTVPVLVWADVDCGIADMVRYLNTIPGVRTIASCQGTLGEGGPNPYRAQVMAQWEESVEPRLRAELDVTDLGPQWGYLHPRGPAPAPDLSEGSEPELTIVGLIASIGNVVKAARAYVAASDVDAATLLRNDCDFLERHATDLRGARLASSEHPSLAEMREKAAKYDRINTPELIDFVSAVENEALHQRERWGVEGDGGKTDADWFWLIGYLAGKALHNPAKDDMEPVSARLHRIVTVAAAAANWHAQTLGVYAAMRPGIAEPAETGASHAK